MHSIANPNIKTNHGLADVQTHEEYCNVGQVFVDMRNLMHVRNEENADNAENDSDAANDDGAGTDVEDNTEQLDNDNGALM